ncbi:MAG: PSD1 and planctomycete cytochrome C domain-containing protein [Gemmataceae bacterium]|nr:PSD1 and planctomycete cytochrome C domain-containing protein [Gemmataceae bacterium]
MRVRVTAISLSAISLLLAQCLAASAADKTVEFNRDIRPILSNNCFVCHGPDNNLRKADLRLDQEKGIYDDRDGYHIIVAGKAADSELFKRIVATEKSKRMPPARTNKALTKEQIELIRAWIEQGGKYQNHWSLIAPVKHEPPAAKNAAWVRNPIDAFILARLEKEGLTPSAAADPRTLIRRLSFDLLGLPPTPQEVDDFVAEYAAGPQRRDEAVAKLVDRLLTSKHFGERMALYWLDLVRYADTGGYHSDNHRDISLYRDWVIDAFNRNVPFDRFTTEQLAGDLLPSPTVQQKIASGYNRLLQTTEEGGAQAKEYQAKYFADRVRNVSTVWLGLTLGCAECHDHKFDPVSTKEFYKFGAFFADIQERPVGRQEQTPIANAAQAAKLREFDEQIAAQQKALTAPDAVKGQAAWEAQIKSAGTKGLPKDVEALFQIDAGKRNAKQKERLANYYRSITPHLQKAQEQLTAVQKRKAEFSKGIPTTLVSMSGPPRTVRVLPRGNWLDDSGEIVQPGTPASLAPLKFDKPRADRLDLARWVTSPDNPLTARVFVNRLWMLFFGQGIVKTLDDFGAQGTWPTHPELLDWLALEFRDKGWDVRHLIKLMATSNTYRQASRAGPELRQRDPYNQLLARQARFRIDAEFVRDNALAISGLLIERVGGDSVRPYQPAGYLRYLNFPTREWRHDKNDNQYRRGLYTYWQRSFLHPSLLAFDAPSREECTVERPRSNTPQQALVLLNDPTYVEASRVFAERVLKEAGKDTAARIDFAFREALQRKATAAEQRILSGLLRQHVQHYQANAKDAEALLKVGERPATMDLPRAELAAWTSVTRAILNLHETITRD